MIFRLCFGDGGTPLVIGLSFLHFTLRHFLKHYSIFSGNTLIGVNSWGLPCATGSPDVHTRIGSFRFWITIVSGL